MDNMTALSYLFKMGGTGNQILVDLSKQIWNYLISKQITITAEHLSGILNVEADQESRNVKGLKRVETKSEGLQKTLLANRSAKGRSICLQGFSATSKVCDMEGGSTGVRN